MLRECNNCSLKAIEKLIKPSGSMGGANSERPSTPSSASGNSSSSPSSPHLQSMHDRSPIESKPHHQQHSQQHHSPLSASAFMPISSSVSNSSNTSNNAMGNGGHHFPPTGIFMRSPMPPFGVPPSGVFPMGNNFCFNPAMGLMLPPRATPPMRFPSLGHPFAPFGILPPPPPSAADLFTCSPHNAQPIDYCQKRSTSTAGGGAAEKI